MRSLAITIGILLCSAFLDNAAAQEQDNAESFVRDPNMPFVYLKFDHLGKGVRRSQDEPSARIWLHFVNNCKAAIQLRTYGVPVGSVAGEVGVMDEVTADRPILTIISGHDHGSLGEHKETSKMPEGYESEVSGVITIAPGETVLFSVPVTHVGSRNSGWHMEIPFKFDEPHGKGGGDALAGGEPIMALWYSHYDLPDEAKTAIDRSQ